MTTKEQMNHEITHTERERAYAEGEKAFKEGAPRVSNPYSKNSPTLEQVWMNGWDHSRRMNKRNIRR